MISPAFAAILAGGRAQFNARAAEARRRFPALDMAAFGAFLRDGVDPLVVAVAAAAPERAGGATLAAYDMALELVCQRWFFSSRHMQAAPPARFRAQLVAAFLASLDEALGGFSPYAVTMTPPAGFWYAIHWDEIAFELGDERYLLHFSHSD